MAPIDMKVQCLQLADGDVTRARAMLDWLLEPLLPEDAAKLAPPALGTQPEIQPSGTARR